jgi:hypothetical protein
MGAPPSLTSEPPTSCALCGIVSSAYPTTPHPPHAPPQPVRLAVPVLPIGEVLHASWFCPTHFSHLQIHCHFLRLTHQPLPRITGAEKRQATRLGRLRRPGPRKIVPVVVNTGPAGALSSGRVGGGGPIRGSQPPLLALPRRKATHCADKLLQTLRTS